jgi:hypothetical protein
VKNTHLVVCALEEIRANVDLPSQRNGSFELGVKSMRPRPLNEELSVSVKHHTHRCFSTANFCPDEPKILSQRPAAEHVAVCVCVRVCVCVGGGWGGHTKLIKTSNQNTKFHPNRNGEN